MRTHFKTYEIHWSSEHDK